MPAGWLILQYEGNKNDDVSRDNCKSAIMRRKVVNACIRQDTTLISYPTHISVLKYKEGGDHGVRINKQPNAT